MELDPDQPNQPPPGGNPTGMRVKKGRPYVRSQIKQKLKVEEQCFKDILKIIIEGLSKCEVHQFIRLPIEQYKQIFIDQQKQDQQLRESFKEEIVKLSDFNQLSNDMAEIFITLIVDLRLVFQQLKDEITKITLKFACLSSQQEIKELTESLLQGKLQKEYPIFNLSQAPLKTRKKGVSRDIVNKHLPEMITRLWEKVRQFLSYLKHPQQEHNNDQME